MTNLKVIVKAAIKSPEKKIVSADAQVFIKDATLAELRAVRMTLDDRPELTPTTLAQI